MATLFCKSIVITNICSILWILCKNVKVFLWMLCKKAILTWNELQKRVWTGPGISVLCKGDAELSDLFECTYSKHIWDICAWNFGVDININLKDTLRNTLKKNGHVMGLVRTIIARIHGERGTVGFLMIHIIQCIIVYIILFMMLSFGWTGIPSNEDMLQLSDGSPGNEFHSMP